jgi:Xaa-Pro dipeptidase
LVISEHQMDRIESLRQVMAARNVDVVALGPGAHMAWLLDLKPHGDERPLVACITATGAGLLMPGLEADSARQQTDLPFYTWDDADGPNAALAAMLDALQVHGARGLVLDETMRADHAALIQDALPGATRQFTATTLGALRMRKDAEEYRILKTNAQTADVAMQAAWAAMAPGMTEAELADIARKSFAAQGAKPIFTIIGAGGNGAFPHHHTGQTPLAPGQAVVMDIGGAMGGYSSDITRMALMGDGPDGYQKVHDVVDAAVEAALAAARPGRLAKDVDAAARGVISQAGYGDYFLHRTGHGMGVEVHEPPYLTGASETVLDEGMVFSIEPGIYLPNRFGIRLEEIVILRADGPEILSDLPRDAVRIEA